MSFYIESALGRNLFTLLGNEGRLIRKDIQGDLCDFVGHRHFQVESDTADFFQEAHVAILNMTPVFTQMHCDRVGSAQFRQNSRMNRVRFVGTSSLTDGGDVVDVHTQQWHWNDAPQKCLN